MTVQTQQKTVCAAVNVIRHLRTIRKETTGRVQGHFPGSQWLTLRTLNTEGPGSIPGQGTRSQRLPLKILYVATKTQHSQINP